MGLSRQEHCSGFPCSPPGDLPQPGIEPVSPVASALQVDSLLLSHQGSPETLFMARFKFPGHQKIHVSKKWGFTEFIIYVKNTYLFICLHRAGLSCGI